MKNFFISLVLLFSVAIFASQIAVGEPTDSALNPQSIPEWKPRIVSCISNKKEQLPKEYIGPNLKLVEVPKEYSIATVVEIKTDANGKKVLTPIEHRFIPCDPGQSYYVDVQEPYSVEIIKKLSKVCDCKEYVEVFGSKGYEVTDVPIGSYLKYIPETKEMQVLPDTEESRKEILERQREQQQIINKRKEELEKEERKKKEIIDKMDKKIKEIERIMQEKGVNRLQAQMIVDKKIAQKLLIKDIFTIVLTVLGFIIIIGIFWHFAKNIFKKFKKK
ncbi:MAG: hypothetical protein J5594_00585 [Elusimicrobiaceae bacterium]|nr:hypothetical protein [Elusimicrobiaceae bacterium]